MRPDDGRCEYLRLALTVGVPGAEARLAPARIAGLRTRLLIIDDLGPEPLTAEQRRDLLEIVDDRYEKGSLLVTSQIPVTRWHELVGDPTIGDAILDRVVHRAHRIELKGSSLRKPDAVTALDSQGNRVKDLRGDDAARKSSPRPRPCGVGAGSPFPELLGSD